MKTCATCKHWKGLDNGWGMCMLINGSGGSPAAWTWDDRELRTCPTYGCTLYEVKPKPIVFETTFQRQDAKGMPSLAVFPEGDVMMGTHLFNRRFKVTIEPIE